MEQITEKEIEDYKQELIRISNDPFLVNEWIEEIAEDVKYEAKLYSQYKAYLRLLESEFIKLSDAERQNAEAGYIHQRKSAERNYTDSWNIFRHRLVMNFHTKFNIPNSSHSDRLNTILNEFIRHL